MESDKDVLQTGAGEVHAESEGFDFLNRWMKNQQLRMRMRGVGNVKKQNVKKLVSKS
jgi:hypothetical protein